PRPTKAPKPSASVAARRSDARGLALPGRPQSKEGGDGEREEGDGHPEGHAVVNAGRRGQWPTALALHYECGPKVRCAPAFLPPHLLLGGPQRRRGRQPFGEHRAVEVLHQLRRSFVVDLPQAGDDAARSSIHETAGDAEDAFAVDVMAEARPAGAQDDEVGVYM